MTILAWAIRILAVAFGVAFTASQQWPVVNETEDHWVKFDKRVARAGLELRRNLVWFGVLMIWWATWVLA